MVLKKGDGMRRRWGRLTGISILGLMCLHGKDGYADSFDKFDFSLRFPAALSRFSTYADVAGVGGASAGSKWQSSTNPAGMAWEPMPPGAIFTASPQFSTIGFDGGTRLNAYVESLTMDDGNAGRFLVSVVQARSNKSTDYLGLNYDFSLDLGQVAWGIRFSPEWAAGVAFSYDRSDTNFDTKSADVSHTSDETYSAKLGVHYLASARLHLGLVFEEDAAPSQSEQFDYLGTGIGTLRVRQTTWQTMVRPGIAFEYAPQSTIYADYQFARFSNTTGTMMLNRLFAGVEQRTWEGVFLRGGFVADAHSNIGWTTGVGFYPTSAISLDFAFQDNYFPELVMDFGRSQTYSLSASISF